MLISVPIEHENCLLRLHFRPHTIHLGTSTVCLFVATVILPDQILYYIVTSSTCFHCQNNAFSTTRENLSLITSRLMASLRNVAQLIEMLFEAKLLEQCQSKMEQHMIDRISSWCQQ